MPVEGSSCFEYKFKGSLTKNETCILCKTRMIFCLTCSEETVELQNFPEKQYKSRHKCICCDFCVVLQMLHVWMHTNTFMMCFHNDMKWYIEYIASYIWFCKHFFYLMCYYIFIKHFLRMNDLLNIMLTIFLKLYFCLFYM